MGKQKKRAELTTPRVLSFSMANYTQSTNTFEVENLDQLMLLIGELQSAQPKFKKQLNTIIRASIRKAVKDVKDAAKNTLTNDPRKAFNAVRSAVYKQIFGGQVNILSRRKNNGKMYVGEKPRTLRTGQRGGNRMKRGYDTNRIDGYYGSDRGFILRFINAGTTQRTTKTTMANRGTLIARNWFKPAADQGMQKACEEFSELFDRALVEIWNEKI